MVTRLTALLQFGWANGMKTGRKEIYCHSTNEREAGETAKTTVVLRLFHCPGKRFAQTLDHGQAYCNETERTT